MKPQPLGGIKVLDLTTLLPGPLATLMLAECGAEVIKIESPRGDDMRRLGLGVEGDAAVFALLNAGKRGLTLDLKTAPGRDEFLALAGDADVLVEQFRPGVMRRLGFDYQAVSALNPRLIYCSITGYGQEGPLSQRAGHDLNYLAETGVLALNPGPDGAPSVPPVLAADIAGGSYPAFFNILLAILERERTGTGRHLDIAMADGLFPFAFWALAQGWGGGNWPEPRSELLGGGSPRYRVYPARDGELAAVAAIEQRFWDSFCAAIALPDELRGPDADTSDVIAAVSKIIAARDAAHWREVFDEADCCCCIVTRLETAVSHPHFLARGLFSRRIATGAGGTIPALPLPIARTFLREEDEAADGPGSGS